MLIAGIYFPAEIWKSVMKKSLWYIAGLHFECQKCGACCAGPDEGYIWVTRKEIELIADFLGISANDLREKYLKRIGLRKTIIEQNTTKDCIFLRNIDGQKQCVIYPVRPSQCRSWPFWKDNIACPDNWNRTAQKCPGINRGRLYEQQEIQRIKGNKKWWLTKENSSGE
jgi:uncharacterized protein